MNYVFSFWRTRFIGLNHEDDPEYEEFVTVANSWKEAIEKLKSHLHEFRGSNAFEHFMVQTEEGLKLIETKPSILFDIHGILNHAQFQIF